MNTNTQLAPIVELRQFLTSPAIIQRFTNVLPPHIDASVFTGVVMTAVNKNNDLLKADRGSLLTSCTDCAADGLKPDGREAALVVFGNKVTYMPMVKGIYKLAKNSGEVKNFYAEIVHRNDDFDYEKGFNVRCEHTPNLDDPGDIRGAYAIAVTNNDVLYAEYMSVVDIEKIRSRSRAAQNGPWVTDWNEMAKKTLIHRLGKVLPMSPMLLSAVQRIEGDYDFNQTRTMQDVTPPPAPERQEYIDPPEHMSDALDGGMPEDETPDEDPETKTETETETTPEKIYRLISKDGIVIDFDSIEEWQDKAVKGVSKLKAESSIKAFRERHGAIMAHLNSVGYEDQVKAVSDAIDAALKPDNNEPKM